VLDDERRRAEIGEPIGAGRDLRRQAADPGIDRVDGPLERRARRGPDAAGAGLGPERDLLFDRGVEGRQVGVDARVIGPSSV
jgi:hypothetical protein